jgi:hypothetical protein
VQFFDEQRQDVELAHDPEPFSDLPEPAPETPRDVRVQFEDGQNLPQPARRDARAMKGADIALLEPL